MPWVMSFMLLFVIPCVHMYNYVIIPGMGGSILRDAVTQTQLWPPRLIRLKDMEKLELDCDTNHDCISRNVVTMPLGETSSIRLTNYITSLVTKNAYYNPLIDALSSSNHQVHALPYDFRRLLCPMYMTALFSEFKSYLEHIRAHDGTIIVCHSLGGILFHQFITNHVSDEWAVHHLKKMYWVSVPFGGCPEAVHSVVTNSVNIFSYPLRLKTLKYFGGFYHLFPFSSNPVIRYHSTSFTPHDYEDLFSLLGQDGCYKLYKGIRHHQVQRRKQPTVASVIVYNDDQPTKTVIDMGNIRNSIMGAGDGLVPQESLLFPLMWWNNENIAALRISGSEHSRICGHKKVIDMLLDEQ